METIFIVMVAFIAAIICGVGFAVTLFSLTYYMIQRHIRMARKKIAAMERV